MCEKRDRTVCVWAVLRVLGDEEVPKDSVENMLDFIRFKWERHVEDNEDLEKGNVFALCTVDSVRGRVHIVRVNELVDLMHGTVTHKAAVEQHAGNDVEWQRDIFYVQRFFHHE